MKQLMNPICCGLLLSAVGIPAVSAATVSELEERIIAIEKKTEKSEKKNSRKYDSLKRKISNNEDRLRISGFMSAGLTKASQDVEASGIVYKDEFTFDPDSMVGLQFDFRISEDFSATVQTVAKGAEDWGVDAEWAFLKYQPSSNWYARAGRLRLPLYLYSESLEVGHAYPWVRPPIGFYQTVISAFEGADLFYSLETAGWSHDFQTFVGTNKQKASQGGDEFDVSITDLYGVNYTLSKGSWLMRLGYTQFVFGIDFIDLDEAAKLYNAAFKYENDTWLVSAEYGLREPEEGTVLGADLETAGLTLGYRFGQWMPYAVAVSTSTLNDTPQNAEHSRASTIGVRYDVNSNVAIKMQSEHFHHFDGTSGPFQSAEEPVDIYSFVVDAVF